MSEREYMSKVAKIFNSVPGCRFRVMPDTGGKTHKKPYDAFMVFQGKHFSIEGKSGNAALEPHQHKGLQEDTAAGAKGFIFRFISSGVSVIKYDGEDEDKYIDMSWEDLRPAEKCILTGGINRLIDWMVMA